MYELNEEIQNLAEAFGERYFVESAIKVMDEECIHKGAHNLLYQNIFLHMATHVIDNMAFYLQNDLVNAKAA